MSSSHVNDVCFASASFRDDIFGVGEGDGEELGVGEGDGEELGVGEGDEEALGVGEGDGEGFDDDWPCDGFCELTRFIGGILTFLLDSFSLIF